MKGSSIMLSAGEASYLRNRETKERRRQRLLQVRRQEALRAKETRQRYQKLQKSAEDAKVKRMEREHNKFTNQKVVTLQKRCRGALGALGAAHESARNYTKHLHSRALHAKVAWRGSDNTQALRAIDAGSYERAAKMQRRHFIRKEQALRRRKEVEEYGQLQRLQAWEHDVKVQRSKAKDKIRLLQNAPPKPSQPITKTASSYKLLRAPGVGLDFTTTRFHAVVDEHKYPSDKENEVDLSGVYANGIAGAEHLLYISEKNAPIEAGIQAQLQAREYQRSVIAGTKVGDKKVAVATINALDELAAIDRECRLQRNRNTREEKNNDAVGILEFQGHRSESKRQEALTNEFERMFLQNDDGGRINGGIFDGMSQTVQHKKEDNDINLPKFESVGINDVEKDYIPAEVELSTSTTNKH